MSTKTGIELIAEERLRQVVEEKWSYGHDDGHDEDQMATAAACYVLPFRRRMMPVKPGLNLFCQLWPWDNEWWKPTPDNRVRELVKAGALIAAEIDRLQRAEGAEEGD